jgi:hypothetical protein
MGLSIDQLRLALNLHNITRFQTHETLKTDNVSNHSFRACAFYDYFGGTEPMAMLFHDLEESITGDLPSPIKKYLQGLEIFELIRPKFQDDKQKRLGKMCDKLDLVVKLQTQMLNTNTLPPDLYAIYEKEKDMLMDIAKEVGLKSDVLKLLSLLKKSFDRDEVVERLKAISDADK